MKHKAVVPIVIAFALLATIPTAFADNNKSDKKKSHGKSAESDDQQLKFKGMDQDLDGRISRAEWRGNDQSFSNHDRNRDGYIAGVELGHSDGRFDGGDVPAQAPTSFLTLDHNQDGGISQLEWDGVPEAFRRLDVNQDGVLGPREYPPPSSPNPGPFPNPAPATFAALDRNNDGRISQLEWGGTPETFKRLDVNHDGVLGPKEFASGTPGAQSNAQVEFAALDRNKDGRISQLEWDGTPETFKRLDVNHDGVLGPKEFASGMPGAQSNAQVAFAALDHNKDGRISQLEWDGTPQAFKRLDVNHDGVLGPKEFASGTPSAQSAAQLEFAVLDLNKDGRISQLEWTGDPASFKNLDTNHDGVLGPKEFSVEVQSALRPM